MPIQNMGAGTEAAIDISKYTIDSPKEVVSILRSVMQKSTLVTVYFNHGREFILTSILDVDADDESVILDYGAAEEVNRKVLSADKINVVTSQDRVKVQFTVSRIEATRFDKHDAFRIPLPDSLVKLQRREFYRLATPLINPLKCTFPLPKGGTVDGILADISVGGIGVTGLPPDLLKDIGKTYPGCRIVLPELGTIVATLELRNCYEVTLKSGGKTQRSGWQFLDVRPNTQVLIQRYIIKLDRERRSRLVDQ